MRQTLAWRAGLTRGRPCSCARRGYSPRVHDRTDFPDIPFMTRTASPIHYSWVVAQSPSSSSSFLPGSGPFLAYSCCRSRPSSGGTVRRSPWRIGQPLPLRHRRTVRRVNRRARWHPSDDNRRPLGDLGRARHHPMDFSTMALGGSLGWACRHFSRDDGRMARSRCGKPVVRCTPGCGDRRLLGEFRRRTACLPAGARFSDTRLGLAYRDRHLRAVIALVAPLTWRFLRDWPSDVGSTAYGSSEADAPAARPRPAGNPFSGAIATLVDVARYRTFWLLASTFFICGASTNGLIGTHLISASHDHGIRK